MVMTSTLSSDGHDGSRCGARKRQGEGTCEQPAGWGTDHVGIGYCKLHGGKTPGHAKSAQTEVARRAVETYGLPREIAPDRALLEEVHRTAGHVAWLGRTVADLDDLTQWGQAGRAPSVWVEIYQRERAHFVRVAKTALDAGIAERQVRLAERYGDMLADVIDGLLDGLDLTNDQRAKVPELVPTVLRAVGATG